jgi:hypothetical protein
MFPLRKNKKAALNIAALSTEDKTGLDVEQWLESYQAAK